MAISIIDERNQKKKKKKAETRILRDKKPASSLSSLTFTWPVMAAGMVLGDVFSQHKRQMLKQKTTTHLANKSFVTGHKAPAIQRAGLLNQGSLERIWGLWPGMRGENDIFVFTYSLFPSITNVCNKPEGYSAVPRTYHWQKAQVFPSHMTVCFKYLKTCPSHLIILGLMDLPGDRAIACILTEACLLCVMNNFNVSITTFL